MGRISLETKRKRLDRIARLLRKANEDCFFLADRTAGYAQTQIRGARESVLDAQTLIEVVQKIWDGVAASPDGKVV